MWQYPLSEFCSKQTRAVCFHLPLHRLLWQPVWLRHSHSSTCYLTWSRALLITPLHVTVVVSFNLLWGQFGIKSSVVCNLHTERKPFGSGSPKSVCLIVLATSICISVRVKVCTWADYLYTFKFNTALLPPLLAVHVSVVQQNLVWTSFLADFNVSDGVCFHTQRCSCASGQVPKSEDLYPQWKVSILVFTTVAIFSIKSGDLDIQFECILVDCVCYK